MNTAEKKACVKRLAHSQDKLLSTLATVTEALFVYKVSADSWSMAELVEHIMLSEKGILRAIHKFGATPAAEAVTPNLNVEQLEMAVNNREKKYQSPEFFIPKGIFKDKAAAIEAFKTHRVGVTDFVATTEIPLKQIGFPHFVFGMIDGANWLTFMSGHCERHVDQMEEIRQQYALTVT